jgi:hypothetical protein
VARLGRRHQGRARRSSAGWGGPGRSAVRPGPGVAGVALRGALGCGGGMDGSDARERERSERKKLWGRVLYPLMFVGPTHQLMNLSRLAYVAAVIPYVRRSPDEHIQI